MSIDEKAIQDLIDERDIRKLVARYSDAVTRNDADAWIATWTDDGVWDVGIAKAAGRDAVLTTWQKLMGHFRFVTQLPQSGVIEIDGDVAAGTWHYLEIGWPSEGPGTLTIGHYVDGYARTAEGWRFSERIFRILYMGPGDLSGSPVGSPK